jgi:glycosyltransferase involved in cell wall biosynthesis
MIIGDGEMRGVIEKTVQEKNLEKNFTFTGWMTDLFMLYQGIDILLLTSKNEGTPVTIIEALAFGVPVVARDVGGVPDIFDFYDRDYLIEGDNPQDYVDAIERMISRGMKISEETQKEVKRFYCAKRLITDIENLYINTINQKRKNRD